MRRHIRLSFIVILLILLAVSCAPPKIRRLSPYYQVYLPIVLNSNSDNPLPIPDNSVPLLGAQLEFALGNRDRYAVADRIYHFPISWRDNETSPGVYRLPSYATDNITRFNNKIGVDNYEIIIGFRNAPDFYRAPNSPINAPPLEEYYLSFAKYIEYVYNNIHPWGVEIWNEPEFTSEESACCHQFFGGFGRDGASYGRMVRVIYDYLKPKYPDLNIVSVASFGSVNKERALEFVQLAVNNGMKADYYSFHYYIHYYSVITDTIPFGNIWSFSSDVYRIFPVRQLVTEVSVTRDTNLPEIEPHQQRQAELLEYLIDNYQRSAIRSFLWYTLANNGWMHSDLIRGGVLMPVYNVWKDYSD